VRVVPDCDLSFKHCANKPEAAGAKSRQSEIAGPKHRSQADRMEALGVSAPKSHRFHTEGISSEEHLAIGFEQVEALWDENVHGQGKFNVGITYKLLRNHSAH